MLKTLNKKLKRNNKGFTLVELLVVIAIIGILAAVATPTIFKNIEKSRVADLESDYNAIKTAVLSFSSDNSGTLPASSDDSAAATTGLAVLDDYLDTTPVESPFGGDYELLTNATDGTCELTFTPDSPVIKSADHDIIKKLKEDLGDTVVDVTTDGVVSLTLVK